MITLTFLFSLTHERLATVECPTVPRVGDRITIAGRIPLYKVNYVWWEVSAEYRHDGGGDERYAVHHPPAVNVNVYLEFWNPTEAKSQEEPELCPECKHPPHDLSCPRDFCHCTFGHTR